MSKYTWREAEPYWGAFPGENYKRSDRSPWPSDAEYRALRQAKEAFDRLGDNTQWCSCGGTGCNHVGSGQGQAAPVLGGDYFEHALWVAVRGGRNKFGYESTLYYSPCNDEPGNALMNWLGVPLRVETRAAPQRVIVDRRRVYHEVHHEPEYRQRSVSAALNALRR
jgi:hypothetical protein